MTIVDFFVDPICPYTYQTSIWLREVRQTTDIQINWRFFSLEEVRREPGAPHAWELITATGWPLLRVAAFLRRASQDACESWYEAVAHAIHIDGINPNEESIAKDLLRGAELPLQIWDDAMADPSTHLEVQSDHAFAVTEHGAFGVPLLVIGGGRAMFGPVVVPAPVGEQALKLWDIAMASANFAGLYEIKRPRTQSDLDYIASTIRLHS